MPNMLEVGGQAPIMDPTEVARRQQLAKMLMEGGRESAQAPRHWTQALGSILQTGIGSYQAGQAARGQAAGQASGNQALAQMLMGGDGKAAMANPYSADQAMKVKAAEQASARSLSNQERLMKMKLEAQNADPMRQLQMDNIRSQIEERRNGGGAGRVGMQPIYGVDEAGNVVVMQPSSSGELVQSKLPPGVRVDPGLVAGEKAKATASGKWAGGSDQRTVGKQRLTEQLKGMVGNYLELDKAGGIVNPDRGALANVQARTRASGVGQAIGGAVGTQEQSIRNRIENVRPLLMQGIMQASGMSARALDSNRELDFYLRAATDPTQDLYSNLVAIDVLDKTYGLGNVLSESVPPDILERVQQDSAKAISARPIGGGSAPAAPSSPPVAGARQAPDGNWYVPDPNRPGKFLKVE
jgi:hypothetical protein